MARPETPLRRILEGNSDTGIPFLGLRNLLLRLGFRERVRGSHHMFRRPDVEEMINLQRYGHEAKGYQLRQVRRVLRRLRQELED